ncbi:MAG: hypothetical protein E6Q36_06985 [Chryseobacterium sp.]|nr:MAG: hypothetical protein E6Q36_06985 [Chryseobacterium sp.]
MNQTEQTNDRPAAESIISVLATLQNLIDSAGAGAFVIPLRVKFIKEVAGIIDSYLREVKPE